MINNNILSKIEAINHSISEVSVYDLNVHSAIECYMQIANKINELIKEVIDYQGLLSDELLKELDYLNKTLQDNLKNSNDVIDKTLIDKITEIDNKIEENNLLIETLTNYSSRLSYLERMMDLLMFEMKSQRLETIFNGNYYTLVNSKDGLLEFNYITGRSIVNIKEGALQGKVTDYTGGELICNGSSTRVTVYSKLIKPKTTYSIISTTEMYPTGTFYACTEGNLESLTFTNVGNGVYTLTTPASIDCLAIHYMLSDNATINKDDEMVIILEGDYSNNPIDVYFEGIKSTFEDCLVDDKYELNINVVGKNKFDGELERGSYDNTTGDKTTSSSFNEYVRCVNYIPVRANTHYKTNENLIVFEYDKNKNFIQYLSIYNDAREYITSVNCKYIRFRLPSTDNSLDINIQIEEGDTKSTYDTYKKYSKTFYLNSPLLEGDTIKMIDDKVNHVHNYNKIVLDGSDDEGWSLDTEVSGDNCIRFKTILPNIKTSTSNIKTDKFITRTGSHTDTEYAFIGTNTFSVNILKTKLSIQDVNGFKDWLQNNPTTVIYQIVTPTYEIIDDKELLFNSFNGCSIEYNSLVEVNESSVTYSYDNSTTSLTEDDTTTE